MAKRLVQYFKQFRIHKMNLHNCPSLNVGMNNNIVPLKKRILNGISTSTETQIIKCNDPNAVNIAEQQLSKGNVIALPTDTVYGLACNANDPEAIGKLYDIKGRDDNKPVAICVANIEDLKHYGEATHLPDGLLKLLLPGAVTLVLNKSKFLDNPYLNPGVHKIGIRIPDCDFIRDISAQCRHPIALTSANRSSEPSTLSIEEFRSLWPQLGAIFDGGPVGLTEQQRVASTVVDLSRPEFYQIIRDGVASKPTINSLKKFGLICDS